MQLVDLTGTWRDGEFYKVKAIHQCRGCEFYDDEKIRGQQCYDILPCVASKNETRHFIYINTDDAAVARYIEQRMDYVPNEKLPD